MSIFGTKNRATRGCASKLACGRRIDPADCTVFTVICGEFATSRRADVGIGPYRVLREFTAAHRADRGVRPYAGLEILHENEGDTCFLTVLGRGQTPPAL